MVERFFSVKDRGGGNNKKITSSEADSEAPLITLLSGPPSCGKTSLLFQYAVNLVESHSEGYVVFICHSRRFQLHPPFLSQGVDPCSSPHLFQRILIKYVDDKDEEALIKYFAAFHLLPSFPLAVIVDDFSDFFPDSKCQMRYHNPRGRDLALVRALALSHSAISHANKTAPCQLLLSDTHHGDSPKLLFLYQRWVSSLFTVHGDSSGSFLLKKSISFNGSTTGYKTARYSIALHYLVLEGFLEDGHL